MTFEIDRRMALISASAAAVVGGLSQAALAASVQRSFPRGFLWGTSTAAHQIEGGNVNSDFWLLENIEPKTFREPSGDACDSYNRWDQDIALLKTMGLTAYRFSIEWSRIEPNPGQFSQAQLDHYRRFIAALRRAGIAPVMTFFHGTAPRWFAERGGWLNPEAPNLFARFCDKAIRALGDGIAYACTINEPQVSLTFRMVPGAREHFASRDAEQYKAHEAAARACGAARFVTMNYPAVEEMQAPLMAGHRQALAAIKAVRADLPTGVTLNLVDFQPGNEGSDVAALRRQVYGPWLEAARTGDFIGVQVYQQVRLPGPGAALPPVPAMPFVEADQPREAMKQPSALRNLVEYVYAETGKPIFVTENGIETDDDRRRAWYIREVIGGLGEAIAKGAPVLGYMHWTLMDNFEWGFGYSAKYGLAETDFHTFERKLKPSAAVYRGIVRAGGV